MELMCASLSAAKHFTALPSSPRRADYGIRTGPPFVVPALDASPRRFFSPRARFLTETKLFSSLQIQNIHFAPRLVCTVFIHFVCISFHLTLVYFSICRGFALDIVIYSTYLYPGAVLALLPFRSEETPTPAVCSRFPRPADIGEAPLLSLPYSHSFSNSSSPTVFPSLPSPSHPPTEAHRTTGLKLNETGIYSCLEACLCLCPLTSFLFFFCSSFCSFSRIALCSVRVT